MGCFNGFVTEPKGGGCDVDARLRHVHSGRMCLSECTVTFFSLRDGQMPLALRTAMSSQCSIPERVNGCPRRLAKTRAVAFGFRRRIHVPLSLAVFFHSGMERSLRPLPWIFKFSRNYCCGGRRHQRSER
jgi:hypothetical protein